MLLSPSVSYLHSQHQGLAIKRERFAALSGFPISEWVLVTNGSYSSVPQFLELMVSLIRIVQVAGLYQFGLRCSMLLSLCY